MTNQLTKYKNRVPIGSMFTSTGTWTRVTNSGIPYYSKSAAAETAKVTIPIQALSADGAFGGQLTTIDIPVRVATANLVSAPTLTVYRRNASLAVTGAGTNMTASSVTGTLTGATITAAATDRLLRFTVTTPALDYGTDSKADYVAELTLHAATTSAIRVYDAIAYFQTTV